MNRHDVDGVSFLFGLLFAGAGLLLVGGGGISGALTMPLAGPLLAIGLGVFFVVAARTHPDKATPDNHDL